MSHPRIRWLRVLCAALWLVAGAGVEDGAGGGTEISAMPEGYRLQAYDDCGVVGRQPHVQGDACHTFAPEAVRGEEKALTVTYGKPNFDMVYENLAGGAGYVAAVTYASEKGNRRIQSLTAGEVRLHGPRTLPDGTAERALFRLPAEAIREGRLVLHFVCNEGHNAVASAVELWAPLPSPTALHVNLTPKVSGRLGGQALDLAYEPVAGAEVVVANTAGGPVRATTKTGADGGFEIDVSGWIRRGSMGTVEVTARSGGAEAKATVPFADLYFVEPRFRPVAAQVAGLESAVISLDGAWRIHPSPPENFQTAPTDGGGWADFTVPGQWLQQGFDIPRDRAAGSAKEFEIPKAWAGKRLFLRFEAVHGGAEYWLNGRRLGTSENLYTPVEFDVSEAARPGEKNRLAMTVKVQTPSELASFSSDYAFHNLGGIDRSVRLFALPPVHLAGLHYQTLLDKEYRDATLRLDLVLENAGAAAVSGLSIRTSLEAPGGQRLAVEGGDFALELVMAGGRTPVVRQFPVANPLKWNAEKPHLYKLTVGLYEGPALLERVERSVGFRVVAVREGQLLVNGRSVKLAGVNRHETDPLTGRAATAVHADEDARLLRGASFNYVRTSHYPPTQEFLEACDRIGLYVECEAPFCWTRGGRGENDPRLTKHFLTPTAAMLDYHRDHPSIILWSLANESGSGPDGENRLALNFAAALDLCRKNDPARPVVFNNEWARDGGACDIAVVHYPPFPPEEYSFVKDDRRPILIDEYFPPQTFTFAEELRLNPGLDVVNWSTGQNSPNSYWNRICASRRVIGGAIWAGIDEEFYFADGGVKGYGPWGFVDVWRRKKSLWWDAKRIHSPVWIPVRKVDFTPGVRAARVPVENRYSFTDLGELGVSWELGTERGRCDVKLPPQSKGEIEVPLPAGAAEGALLVLRFTDAAGELVTAHGIRLGSVPAARPGEPGAGCPQWNEDGAGIAIRGEQFRMEIDRSTGKIRPSKQGSSVRLLTLPTLFVTRREDRNVFNPGGLPYAQYPDAGSRVIESVTAEKRGEALAITVRDRYKDFAGSTEVLLDKAGAAAMSFDYAYSGRRFTVSELGLRLSMDRECQEIRWRRQTEWDVYPEDHIGRPEGSALAAPDKKWGQASFPPYRKRPSWPWHLDANELGTRDFRATKYDIYEARLLAPDGSGILIESDATTNVRACLGPDGVQFHILVSNPPAQVGGGERIAGSFRARFLRAK